MVLTVKLKLENVESFAEQFVNGIANDVVNSMVQRVAVDTGSLKNSISYGLNGKSNAQEINIDMLEYGLYVEYGTPPHIIEPKSAKALHWKSGGKDVFAKRVMHPGTRPQPFIRPAIHSDLKEVVKNNLRRHAK